MVRMHVKSLDNIVKTLLPMIFIHHMGSGPVKVVFINATITYVINLEI